MSHLQSVTDVCSFKVFLTNKGTVVFINFTSITKMDLFGQEPSLDYPSEFDDLDFKSTLDEFSKDSGMVSKPFGQVFRYPPFKTCLYILGPG